MKRGCDISGRYTGPVRANHEPKGPVTLKNKDRLMTFIGSA